MNFIESFDEITKRYPEIQNKSGIYVYTREDRGFKFAYVGQSKHIVDRLASHLCSYDSYIEFSLKKHKLFTEENPEGWKIDVFYCEESELNEKEREYMLKYANEGYQLRNKTSGGQDTGKFAIDQNKPSKGYRDGLAQGYKNAQKFVKGLFDKNLIAEMNGKPNKNKEKALNKFYDFINI